MLQGSYWIGHLMDSRGSTMRILVAEDNRDVADTLVLQP